MRRVEFNASSLLAGDKKGASRCGRLEQEVEAGRRTPPHQEDLPLPPSLRHSLPSGTPSYPAPDSPFLSPSPSSFATHSLGPVYTLTLKAPPRPTLYRIHLQSNPKAKSRAWKCQSQSLCVFSLGFVDERLRVSGAGSGCRMKEGGGRRGWVLGRGRRRQEVLKLWSGS